MTTTKRKTDRYFELVETFPPRPIRNDRDLNRTQKVVNELLDHAELSKDERDYLEVLGTLVEVYERDHEMHPDINGAYLLAHLIEAGNLTQRAVADGTGIPETTISELLAGRRDLNSGHIGKLAVYFSVSPAVFLPNPQQSWRRVVIRASDVAGVSVQSLMNRFSRAFRDAELPDSARVFRSMTEGEDFVYFFSPEAAAIATDLLKSFNASPCKEPRPDTLKKVRL